MKRRVKSKEELLKLFEKGNYLEREWGWHSDCSFDNNMFVFCDSIIDLDENMMAHEWKWHEEWLEDVYRVTLSPSPDASVYAGKMIYDALLCDDKLMKMDHSFQIEVADIIIDTAKALIRRI